MLFNRQNTLYVGHLGTIPLYVHWSALIMVYMIYTNSMSRGGFHFDSFLVSLAVLIIGIVLHELGHGLTAKFLGAFGVTITLWAFGGLCSSKRDSLPRRELLIVAAGPAVSFILAGLGYLGLLWIDQERPDWHQSYVEMFLYYTCWNNLWMGIFNCLPIYPLDGGQIVFNAVLSVGGKHLLARQISLFLAVVGALAYLSYRFHLNDNQINNSLIYSVMMMGWLVFNAFRYLR